MRIDWKLLLAFEAVARHGSFSRAASELNVQQPAMSRRVAALETELNVPLLYRTRPTLSLSPEGEILYRAVSGSMSQVQSAFDQIAWRAQQTNVVVNTTIGFASCFLMKRLHAFRAAYPDVVVELVSRDQNDTYQEDAADVVILFDTPSSLPGRRQAIVFEEEMIAVCAPDYLPAPLRSLEEFKHHRLLRLTQGIHGEDWAKFLGLGIALPLARSTERFTSFIIYLQSALDGEGIALGWEHLLHDHLAAGTLQRASPHVYRSNRAYFACLTRRAETNTAAQSFVDWIGGLVAFDGIAPEASPGSGLPNTR